MLVEMLNNSLGSPDGRTVNRYYAGETYDLPDELARIFLLCGSARKVPETPESAAPEIETPEKPKRRKS